MQVGSNQITWFLNGEIEIERMQTEGDGEFEADWIDLITSDGVLTLFINEATRFKLLEALQTESNDKEVVDK